MSLDQIVSAIVDDTKESPYLRAIRLFEFQIAKFNPPSFSKLIANGNAPRAPTKRLRTTRILSAIRFLEDIEAELSREKQILNLSIRDLAMHEKYQKLYDTVIAPNGGWTRIRHSVSVKTFDNRLAMRCKDAEAAAKIIDFSYRFAIKRPYDPRKAGVTSARYVVRKADSYRMKVSDSTIKTRWRSFGPTAVFLYLVLIQKFPLMPPRLSQVGFSEFLLKQTNDIEVLRNFFRAYQQVCKVLAPAGYRPTILEYDLRCDVPPIDAPALTSDLEIVFNDSNKADRSES
jgi:hypothetical protein